MWQPQKIERKHLSLRTWCSQLARKEARFSKAEQMHKICVGIVINFLRLLLPPTYDS
ncbi:MAG: IS1 family transposase [Planctomycetaceae bacterium]|nr:IS1 family transposase [Planctomycetaceae bacterium]